MVIPTFICARKLQKNKKSGSTRTKEIACRQ